MKKKVICGIYVSMFVSLILFSGCEGTVQEPIVALKQKSEEKGNAVAATGVTIAEQVQAPERYQTELNINDLIKITVDASVTVPDGDGIRIKGLKGREFTEKERRNMEKLSNRMDRTYHFYFGNAQSEASSNKMAVLTAALDETETVSSEGTDAWSASSEETVQSETARPSAKKSQKDADKLLAELGLNDFALAGARYQDSSLGVNYVLHYTRQIDGIPITYTSQIGGSVIEDEFGEWMPWEDEQLEFIYDAEGLWRMNWTNPYEISTISEEAVFLLPFSEVKQIFESVMITNYGKSISYTDSYGNYLDNYESYLSSMEINVSSVRLGYMKIQEKGDKNGAKLVPVWDFFGTISYYDMDTGSYVATHEDPFYSLVTINAMDGSVLDRYLGY